ncbi:STAS/SEC14 domain-containing protein [Anatilimnocola sp. NA78]|uniref:STAS/SEC14 domain-containing protein n=1 Tax=Anatilimnocola sp. NA78 TaxID=3415683 RepID=UPI003CE58360
MSHDVRIIAASEFLQTTIEGRIDLSSSEQILRQIAAACIEHDQHHVLIDARKVPERSLSVIDLYQVGSNLQSYGFGPTHRIAIVYQAQAGQADSGERAKFLELVAVNRGSNLRVFGTIEDAWAWLSEEASSGGGGTETNTAPASAE